MALFRKKKTAPPFVTAVIAAGGSSQRMGGENKLLMEVGGVPVLAHTLLAFEHCESISEIVVAAKGDAVVTYSNLAAAFGIHKLKCVVEGGASRAESVYRAACQASDAAQYLAVHDGARPLIQAEEITAVCDAAFACGSAAAAVPIKDTVKRVENGKIAATIDRSQLYAAQTPQTAEKGVLLAALKRVLDEKIPVTDECMALEYLNIHPQAVVCSYENIKITTPEDLIFAESILNKREGIG